MDIRWQGGKGSAGWQANCPGGCSHDRLLAGTAFVTSGTGLSNRFPALISSLGVDHSPSTGPGSGWTPMPRRGDFSPRIANAYHDNA